MRELKITLVAADTIHPRTLNKAHGGVLLLRSV